LRIYNTYVVSLVLAAGLVNAILASLGQSELEIYFIINIVVYLVITLLYTYFNPRARRALNTIGIVLSAGFIVIVAIKVVEIMSGK
jgi:uncharacterized membrane protein YhhN